MGQTLTIDASESTNARTYQYDKDSSDSFVSDTLSQTTYDVSYSTTGKYRPRVKVSSGERKDTTNCPTLDVVENLAPTAGAGADQTVDETASVTLDASGSSDPGGDTLSYAWTQVSGSSVSLTDPNTATPSFEAPDVGTATTLTFEVTVDDDNGGTDTDRVNITVEPKSVPTADAGEDQTVTHPATVTLDGSGSSDPAGDSLSYSWTQLGGPSVAFDETSVQPSFSTPDVGVATTLEFELTVTDSYNNTDTATVLVLVKPPEQTATQAPTATPRSTSTLTTTLAPTTTMPTTTLASTTSPAPTTTTQVPTTTAASTVTPTLTPTSGTRSAAARVTAQAGQEVMVDFGGSGGGAGGDGGVGTTNATIESVALTTTESGRVSINVTSSTDPLSSTPDFNTSRVTRGDDALAYFSIESSVPDDQIREATIRLRVPKSTVEEADTDADEITMYRFDENGDPVAQPTELAGEREDAYVYEVSADGFSEWVAGTKRPSIRVSQASIAIQATGDAGSDQARIDARITNNGETDAVYVTRLLLDGDVIEDRRVTVPRGGTVQVTFQREFQTTGTYLLTVNNVTAGTVSVAENGTLSVQQGGVVTTTTTDDTTGLFGPTLSTAGRVALLVVLALLGYAASRSRDDGE